jgi:hypothetical protein
LPDAVPGVFSKALPFALLMKQPRALKPIDC